MDPRIARLETQVESLREAVRALAGACLYKEARASANPHKKKTDILNDHLSGEGARERLAALEVRVDDLAETQATQGRVVRRQDERLKKALTIVAQALSASEPAA